MSANRFGWSAALFSLAAISAVSCSTADETETIRVLAASSLTDAFEAMAEDFEAANPGIELELSFGGSSTLARQIINGAPVDVFTSANDEVMQSVVDEVGVAGEPQTLASNELEMAVEPGNPLDISKPQDLAEPDVLVAVCLGQVPCGAAATEMFDRADIVVEPTTEEPNVRSVLSKVELGEVDVGVVYRSDVHAAGDAVTGVAIADEFNVINTYLIAVPEGASHPEAAQSFVDFARGPGGAILEKEGFAIP